MKCIKVIGIMEKNMEKANGLDLIKKYVTANG